MNIETSATAFDAATAELLAELRAIDALPRTVEQEKKLAAIVDSSPLAEVGWCIVESEPARIVLRPSRALLDMIEALRAFRSELE